MVASSVGMVSIGGSVGGFHGFSFGSNNATLIGPAAENQRNLLSSFIGAACACAANSEMAVVVFETP